MNITDEIKPVNNPCPRPEILVDPSELAPIMWTWFDQSQVRSRARFLLDLGVIPHSVLYYLCQESGFTFVEDVQWDGDGLRAAGRGERECPHCGGSRAVMRAACGVDTGVRVLMETRCKCAAYHDLYGEWLNVENVPSNYRNINLAWLVAHEKMSRNKNGKANTNSRFTGLSAEFIDTVLAVAQHPEYGKYNMLLSGPAGTGKSTLSYALYYSRLSEWALKKWESGIPRRAVWRMSARRITSEHHQWEIRNNIKSEDGTPPNPPTITVNTVLRAQESGFMPCLFLEELDKYSKTDFQNNAVHQIVDAIEANKGQVVASSNMSDEALRLAMGPDEFGNPIIRRITERPRGILMDFRKEKVFINGTEMRAKRNGDLVRVVGSRSRADARETPDSVTRTEYAPTPQPHESATAEHATTDTPHTEYRSPAAPAPAHPHQGFIHETPRAAFGHVFNHTLPTVR